MVGTCCGSCGSAVSCKKEAAAAAGAGGGGGEEPDLSGSEGLEANTEFPQSRPGAGRVPLPREALPAGQMVLDDDKKSNLLFLTYVTPSYHLEAVDGVWRIHFGATTVL
ncbi:hypothetical protein J1605_009591 [Eschrichtius robustus]|uniref:Uncharacterized protein n=1 Tax=Eschrichtius robustus TaxID=9764 RepID=A0AB34GUN5_ESCRO|nr:hypothetical protein J1605_009591 [Eschrichtius robustus]